MYECNKLNEIVDFLFILHLCFFVYSLNNYIFEYFCT